MKKPKKEMIKSKTTPNLLSIPPGYKPFLEDVKRRIRTTQIKAATSVNKELMLLYWSIVRDLVEKQEKEKWGSGLIEKFCRDIQKNCPGIEGFSRANIFKMRAFFLAYAKVSQPVRLLEKLPIFRNQGKAITNPGSLQQLVEVYHDPHFVQALPAQLPWSYHLLLLENVKKPTECETVSQVLKWHHNFFFSRETLSFAHLSTLKKRNFYV